MEEKNQSEENINEDQVSVDGEYEEKTPLVESADLDAPVDPLTSEYVEKAVTNMLSALSKADDATEWVKGFSMCFRYYVAITDKSRGKLYYVVNATDKGNYNKIHGVVKDQGEVLFDYLLVHQKNICEELSNKLDRCMYQTRPGVLNDDLKEWGQVLRVFSTGIRNRINNKCNDVMEFIKTWNSALLSFHEIHARKQREQLRIKHVAQDHKINQGYIAPECLDINTLIDPAFVTVLDLRVRQQRKQFMLTINLPKQYHEGTNLWNPKEQELSHICEMICSICEKHSTATGAGNVTTICVGRKEVPRMYIHFAVELHKFIGNDRFEAVRKDIQHTLWEHFQVPDPATKGTTKADYMNQVFNVCSFQSSGRGIFALYGYIFHGQEYTKETLHTAPNVCVYVNENKTFLTLEQCKESSHYVNLFNRMLACIRAFKPEETSSSSKYTHVASSKAHVARVIRSKNFYYDRIGKKVYQLKNSIDIGKKTPNEHNNILREMTYNVFIQELISQHKCCLNEESVVKYLEEFTSPLTSEQRICFDEDYVEFFDGYYDMYQQRMYFKTDAFDDQFKCNGMTFARLNVLRFGRLSTDMDQALRAALINSNMSDYLFTFLKDSSQKMEMQLPNEHENLLTSLATMIKQIFGDVNVSTSVVNAANMKRIPAVMQKDGCLALTTEDTMLDINENFGKVVIPSFETVCTTVLQENSHRAHFEHIVPANRTTLANVNKDKMIFAFNALAPEEKSTILKFLKQ